MKDSMLTPDQLETYTTIPPIIKRTSVPSVLLPISAHYSQGVILDVWIKNNDIILPYKVIVQKKKTKSVKQSRMNIGFIGETKPGRSLCDYELDVNKCFLPAWDLGEFDVFCIFQWKGVTITK